MKLSKFMKKNHEGEYLCHFLRPTKTNLKQQARSFGLQSLAFISIHIGLQLNSAAYSQTLNQVKIEVNIDKKVTLIDALHLLEKRSNMSFAFDQTQIRNYYVQPFSGHFTLEKALDKTLSGLPFDYKLIKGRIAIFPAGKVKPKRADDNPTSLQQGQEKIDIRGTVKDSLGTVIPGVTIQQKNKPSTATTTDQNGRYILSVPESSVLVFSMVGYDSKEEQVTQKDVLDITLSANQANLEEVVVMGFGIKQKKASLVGAVETVRAKDLVATSSNLSTAFAGRIAGVIATQSSGEPGADGANFWIRGISTFGSNSSPLIILDGVEIVSEILNSIAPETIESFSVLKDATATALYGSRGANGVMVITTKNGANTDRMTVNARVQSTLSAPTKIQKIADGVTYMRNYNEAYFDANDRAYFSDDKINGTIAGLDPYIYPNNNWYDLMFKDFTVNQNANINVTGGSKKVDYFLNASYFRENGIYKQQEVSNFSNNNNLNKFSFQSNVAANITPTTRIGVKLNSMLQYRYMPTESSSSLFYNAMRANPVSFPVLFPSETGDDFIRYGNAPSWDGGATDLNPVALLSRGYANQHTSYLMSVFNADQDLSFFTKGLKTRFLASFYNKTYTASYRNLTPFYFWLNEADPTYTDDEGTEHYNTASIGPNGTKYLSTSTSQDGYREYSIQWALEYARVFANKHHINAIALYHQRERNDNTPASNEYEVLPYRQQGFAGRLTYDYKSRYLMEANFGYNGSENFLQGKRWGFFPSLAVGWNISAEPFFKALSEDITLLKLRASWGKAGNDVLATRFPYVTTMNTGQNLYFYYGPDLKRAIGSTIKTVGNPYATWEVSEKVNLGMEVGLHNRLTLIVDAFREKRTGIFMQRRTIPTTAGYTGTTPWGNIGATLNRGIDASLEYNQTFSNDLRVAVRGTFTYAHNEITAQDESATLLYPKTSRIGKPINSVFALISDGLFRNEEDIANSPLQKFSPTIRPGDIKYQDITGDGTVDANDIQAIGYPTRPEIIYGLGPSIGYKKMDFSFFVQGTARVSLLMNNMHPFLSNSNSGFGMMQWIADEHWTASNPNPMASYPRLSSTWNENNTKSSDYWLRDASFIRLKSAEVGYTHKKMRAYLLGTNLLTISKFKLWDPEIGGGNGLSYPLQKTFTLGFQYNF